MFIITIIITMYMEYVICDMCKAICNEFQRERISMIFVV